MREKTHKISTAHHSVIVRGWNVAPLIVLAACARATTHIPLMKTLEIKFKLPTTKIKNTS